MVAEALLREGFSRAPIVRMLGLELELAAGGLARVRLPFREELQQGLGVIHGGILSLVADSACWFAAASARDDSLVTTIELKINYLRPARAADLVAEAEVVQSGRRVVTTRFEVRDGAGARLAVGLSTLVTADVEHEGIPPEALSR